jgi:signal peptidase II
MWWLFGGLAAAVVIADQVSKAIVVANLRPGQSAEWLGDWLRIVYGQNSGALFGLFRDNAALFGVVSVAVVALIVVYQAMSGRSAIVSIALGLLLGGAIGNLADRFRLGFVVDFVDMGIGAWRWYTFNVADAAISTAILILVILAFLPGLAERVGASGATARVATRPTSDRPATAADRPGPHDA